MIASPATGSRGNCRSRGKCPLKTGVQAGSQSVPCLPYLPYLPYLHGSWEVEGLQSAMACGASDGNYAMASGESGASGASDGNYAMACGASERKKTRPGSSKHPALPLAR